MKLWKEKKRSSWILQSTSQPTVMFKIWTQMPLNVSTRLLSNHLIFRIPSVLQKMCKLCADHVTVIASIHVHVVRCIWALLCNVYCMWMLGDLPLIWFLLYLFYSTVLSIMSRQFLSCHNQSQTQHESTEIHTLWPSRCAFHMSFFSIFVIIAALYFVFQWQIKKKYIIIAVCICN